MAGSSWSVFAKTILLPLLIALALYTVVFIITLPLYRRYRSHLTRYSNYTPLGSTFAQQTTSLFSPYLLEPSKTLLQKLRGYLAEGLYRFVVPSTWARDRDARFAEQLGDEEDETGGGLFDAESGEAMVGFDIHANNLSRNGRAGRRLRRDGGFGTEDRPGEQTGHNRMAEEQDADDSNRRLSRELEEGFRDDSGSEASDEEVTIGRRSVSRRRDDIAR